MLYVIVGTDFKKRIARTQKILNTLTTKRPDATRLEFQVDNFSPSALQEHLNTQGLFDEKSIVRFTGVLEEATPRDILVEAAQEMSQSDNAFIITEEKLSKPLITKLEKKGAIVEVFDTPVTARSTGIFDIADLLLQQKKQKLLVTYYEYTNSGVSAEEIVGIIMWQLKSLVLALSLSQQESGLKAFVYNKCRASTWKQSDAQQKYFDLLSAYHESRRGGLTLSERVERFILDL